MITNSFLLSMIRGRIGKTVVVKHYGKKVVLSKVPDMSCIEASPAQRTERNKMKAAVAWAKQTNSDAGLRTGYIKEAGGSKLVYQYLLKQYLVRGGSFLPGQDQQVRPVKALPPVS